jgi:hypothetical protein
MNRTGSLFLYTHIFFCIILYYFFTERHFLQATKIFVTSMFVGKNILNLDKFCVAERMDGDKMLVMI